MIGTLQYFSYKTGSLYLQILYWVSYVVLYTWLLSIANFAGTKLAFEFPKDKLFSYFIVTAVVLEIYLFISLAVQSLITAQF